LDKAINAYENAVLYDKRNWRRHRDLGGLYEQAELLLKAKYSYSRALELNPKEPGLFLSMGRVWRKMTLYSYALPWLEKALVSGQDIGLVQEQLSLLYEGQGQFDKAAAACEATNDDGKRLIYLALLAGNTRIVKEGQSRLTQAKVSRETRQVYENLIELLQHPPMDILAGKTSNPALQAMLKNHFSEEPNQ
jgi:tetratricopeptide (TPR) repeat protein